MSPGSDARRPISTPSSPACSTPQLLPRFPWSAPAERGEPPPRGGRPHHRGRRHDRARLRRPEGRLRIRHVAHHPRRRAHRRGTGGARHRPQRPAGLLSRGRASCAIEPCCRHDADPGSASSSAPESAVASSCAVWNRVQPCCSRCPHPAGSPGAPGLPVRSDAHSSPKHSRKDANQTETPRERGLHAKRLMGFEPTTFCMASLGRVSRSTPVNVRRDGTYAGCRDAQRKPG